MRIHALQTGSVAVKSAARVVSEGGRQRLIPVELSPLWLQPVPIFAYAIEFPDGLTLIDAGQVSPESAGGQREHSYDGATGSGSVYRWTIQYEVARRDEIDQALQRRGLSAASVRRVILTHLHSDHASGLIHFPQAEFFVSRRELDAAQRDPASADYDRRTLQPKDWPAWFEPRPIDFSGPAMGPFPASYSLAEITLVPTHGHSAGQMSAILKRTAQSGADAADALHYFFTGDAAYSQRTLLQRTMVGVSVDLRMARETHARLRQFVRSIPTVLLPAHDPETPGRLAKNAIVPMNDEAAAVELAGAQT